MHTLLHSVPPTLQQATTDPCLCQRLLATHGKVWVSLFWGQCSFLLGPGAHKILFVPSKSLFPQSYVSSGSSMVGLMVISFKRAYAIPRSAAPRAPAPASGHCWPGPLQETLRHSQAGLAQSLWGLLVHTRFCLRPPSISSVLAWRIPGMEEPGGLPSMGSQRVGHDWSDLAAAASLVGMGFDSKLSFTPPTVLFGLLLCPWMWDTFFWWDPAFSRWWLLSSELSQKMSAYPSTPPSFRNQSLWPVIILSKKIMQKPRVSSLKFTETSDLFCLSLQHNKYRRVWVLSDNI